MKKLILVMLMVALVATPCFAQEIEPDGLFSIEGTLWDVCDITIRLSFLPVQHFDVVCYRMGFYERLAYRCDEFNVCRPTSRTYIDSPALSIAFYLAGPSFVDFFIMQPSGFGVHTSFLWGCSGHCVMFCCGLTFEMGIMFKVEDNWIPLEVE